MVHKQTSTRQESEVDEKLFRLWKADKLKVDLIQEKVISDMRV